VRTALQATAPQRVNELDDLDVVNGLDNNDQRAAEQFMVSEGVNGESPLRELLPARLRRRVEALAFPDGPMGSDPLRELLRTLAEIPTAQLTEVSLRLDGVRNEHDKSMWLFQLLFGPTLISVQEHLSGVDAQLIIDPQLIEEPRFAPLPSQDPPDEELVGRLWEPIRLIVELDGHSPQRFRWEPSAGMIALGALLSVPVIEPAFQTQLDLESWLEAMTDPTLWASIPKNWEPQSRIGRRLREVRAAAIAELSKGITEETLSTYLDQWTALQLELRDEEIPEGSPNLNLQEALELDVIQLPENRLALLASHPLRLRWLLTHLREMRDLLVEALSSGLRVNEENPDYFFEQLAHVSPQGTPPIIVGPGGKVGLALRESGWHEEYTPIRIAGQEVASWLATVDDAGIDELTSVVQRYLDTYPYKKDGLSLLLLDRRGDPRLPHRIVAQLRKKTPGLAVHMIVLAPRTSHAAIAEKFSTLLGEDIEIQERVLPETQLILRAWDPNQKPALQDLYDCVDLALAPALFGTNTRIDHSTRERDSGVANSYDPWIHRSSYDSATGGQNVTRVMLPQQDDGILETWSTLCVRYERNSPVDTQRESNTDYFTVQVQFHAHQSLFLELHRVAHWVVTLDSFIGRDQIAALEDRPDVILVRTGVGKNESYTLLVSCQTGKHFVSRRLARKLSSDLALPTDIDPEKLAERMYELGRHVAPGAILQALGLGQASSEIVGLILSRYEVESRFPSPENSPGVTFWLSFDDLLEWFGTTRTRADLGRFHFTVDPETDSVQLDILVVESKFRQKFDLGSAIDQLNRTTVLCKQAFDTTTGAYSDTMFWCQALARALEQTSDTHADAHDLPQRIIHGADGRDLVRVILGSVSQANFTLNEVKGVVVATAANADTSAPAPDFSSDHTVVRLNRPELEATVRFMLDRVAPAQSSDAPIVFNAEAEEEEEVKQTGDPVAQSRSFDPNTSADDKECPDGSPLESVRTEGRDESWLRNRYERLLDTLSQHGVAVDPPTAQAWQDGPGFYVLKVVPRSGVTVDRVVSRIDEIALALRLPNGAKIRSLMDRGSIVFEVPKSPEERYPVHLASIWEACPVSTSTFSIPLGVDLSGSPISVEFSSPDSPHLLVAGATGAGKSVALEALLLGACRYPQELVKLRLIDPKGTELQGFSSDPRVDRPIGMDARDAIDLLAEAVQEMEMRYALMRPMGARSLVAYNELVAPKERLAWILIVLDEYADLTADPNEKSQIEALLRRLTQKARAAGIHIIVATQRPSADVVSTTIRANFPAQLALRVKSATESRIVMDEGGAEALAGQGDAFLRTVRGVQRLQVALPPSPKAGP
jgi:hypothetical protein